VLRSQFFFEYSAEIILFLDGILSKTVLVEKPEDEPAPKDPDRVRVTVILKRLPEARPLAGAIRGMLRFVDRIQGWQPQGDPEVEAT